MVVSHGRRNARHHARPRSTRRDHGDQPGGERGTGVGDDGDPILSGETEHGADARPRRACE